MYMFKILQVFFLATMFSHTLMAKNAINKFINTKGFENASIS